MNTDQIINQITYPYKLKIDNKNKASFIRIITPHHVYYGFESKQLILIDFHNKKNIQLLNTYERPSLKHTSIFNQALSKIRGFSYELLYVNKNQYLALGKKDNHYISIVILNIEINSKGYYEIQDIKNILKNES